MRIFVKAEAFETITTIEEVTRLRQEVGQQMHIAPYGRTFDTSPLSSGTRSLSG